MVVCLSMNSMMIGFVILAVCMVSPPKDSDVVKDVDNGVQLIGKGKANLIMPDISTLSKPRQKEGNTADETNTKPEQASWLATNQWAYPIEIGTAMMLVVLVIMCAGMRCRAPKKAVDVKAARPKSSRVAKIDTIPVGKFEKADRKEKSTKATTVTKSGVPTLRSSKDDLQYNVPKLTNDANSSLCSFKKTTHRFIITPTTPGFVTWYDSAGEHGNEIKFEAGDAKILAVLCSLSVPALLTILFRGELNGQLHRSALARNCHRLLQIARLRLVMQLRGMPYPLCLISAVSGRL